MNSPIYKDYFYTASTASLEYYIVADGNIIFRGKAWRNPDTGLIKINVGKIVRDYMSFDLPDFRPLDDVVTRQEDAYKVFELYSASGSKLDEYKVLFDWYGEWNGETKVLSNPANPIIDPRMKIVWSVYNPTDTDIEMEWLPHVRNTYFKLLDDPIRVSYYGGTYEIRWRTNYYPYENIDLSTVFPGAVFGESTATGTTATFPAADSPFPRTYPIDASYEGQALDETHAIQSIYFNLITKYIDVPKTGGTFPIYWETEIPPENLKIKVVGVDGVEITGVTMSGCTATFPPNTLYCENEITIEYYFAVEGEEDYYLDSTEITTAPRYIDSGVSRDVPIMCDGTFVAFNTPGIQLWEKTSPITDGYWPEANEQFEMSLFRKHGTKLGYPAARYDLSNNIPLCRKTIECAAIDEGGAEGSHYTTWDIGNYSVSANTEWLNTYLNSAYENGCNGGHTQALVSITGNPSPSDLTIYLGGEAADTNTIIKPNANGYDNLWVYSSVTPYQYADFKFKSTGFTETTIRNRLTSGIPIYSQVHVYDGVKVVDRLGTYISSWPQVPQYYHANAFNLETDADGWTTVKTPLPIMQICNLAGFPAGEIWISKNVKYVNINNNRISGLTYEGTKLEFRNVVVTNASNSVLITNGAQCSDGVSYGMSYNYDNWQIGKSDPVVFKGNTIMPASCGNIYDGEEIEPGRTVEITFTGSTPVTSGTFYGYFYGFDGKELRPVSIVTGMSGEYATATLTFDEDVYYLRNINENWRAVSDVFRYVYPNGTGSAGGNLATPLTKMRVIGYHYLNGKSFGDIPPTGTLEFENLRAIIGEGVFKGTGTINKISAPNLVYIGTNAFYNVTTNIKELYIPLIQYMYQRSVPANCTKLTIGKNLTYMHTAALSGCTNMTEVTFEGTIDDWDKMNQLTVEAPPSYVFKSHSNVTTVHCSDGDVTL